MFNLLLRPGVLGFIVGTRAMLGFGAGLLLASKIPEPRRRQIALGLISAGLAATIPAVRSLQKSRTQQQLHERTAWAG